MVEHHQTLRSVRGGWLLNTARVALAAALGTNALLSTDMAADPQEPTGPPPSPAKPEPRQAKIEANSKVKTILGIGAHYDDCVFGIPGTLLKAVKKNHRVVVLSLIGDYSNWKPAQGRSRELVDGTIQLGKEYGVEMRFFIVHRDEIQSERGQRAADSGGGRRHFSRPRIPALAARPSS
jgi:hypothetical protein